MRIDRVKLLVHLVQNLLAMGITANLLEEAADDCRRHLLPEDKVEEKAAILDEIFRVRKIEERYEKNEIGRHRKSHGAPTQC